MTNCSLFLAGLIAQDPEEKMQKQLNYIEKALTVPCALLGAPVRHEGPER